MFILKNGGRETLARKGQKEAELMTCGDVGVMEAVWLVGLAGHGFCPSDIPLHAQLLVPYVPDSLKSKTEFPGSPGCRN